MPIPTAFPANVTTSYLLANLACSAHSSNGESPVVEGWMEEGNRRFHAGKFAGGPGGAVQAYEASIKHLVDSTNHLPLHLLQIISEAAFHLGWHGTAYVYASAVHAFPYRPPSLHALCVAARAAMHTENLEEAIWPLVLLYRSTGAHADDDPSLDDCPDVSAHPQLKKEIAKLVAQFGQKQPGTLVPVAEEDAAGLLSLKAQYMSNDHVLKNVPNAFGMPHPSEQQASATQDVLQLKAEGVKAFQSKDYSLAFSKCREALATFRLLPKILNQLAASYLNAGSEIGSFKHALAVLAFQPSNTEAYAHAFRVERRATVDVPESYASQTWLNLSNFVAVGLQYDPTNVQLLFFQRQACEALEALAASPSTTASPSNEGMHQWCAIPESVMVSIEMLGLPGPGPISRVRDKVEKMANEQPVLLRRLERCSGPAPDAFHSSFIKSGRLPEGLHPSVAQTILKDGSSNAFGGWLALCQALAPEAAAAFDLDRPGDGKSDPRDPIQFTSDMSLVVRLRETGNDRMMWFRDSPIGALNVLSRSGARSSSLATFSSVTQYALPIPTSGVHVSVDFCDLGVLAETVLKHQQRGGDDMEGTTAPHLRWVGVEGSSFRCAHTLVILQMLRRGSKADHIAQVWYSAGWTAATLHDFHACVAALLDAKGVLKTLTHEVREWLQVWRGDSLPLSEARDHWSDRMKRPQTWIANLLRKDDRMAACAYVVSGDLPVSGAQKSSKKTASPQSITTGSVVMFPYRRDYVRHDKVPIHENFMFTLPPAPLLEERLQGDNVVVAAGVLARRRVEALARALKAKHLVIEVRHATLSQDNEAEVQHIRALEPTSMSWGNLCDCMDPDKLHHLARSCAAPSASHFMHSSDWVFDIKGAFIVDYGVRNEKGKKGKANEKKRIKFWEEAQEVLSPCY